MFTFEDYDSPSNFQEQECTCCENDCYGESAFEQALANWNFEALEPEILDDNLVSIFSDENWDEEITV